jgi:hypothetical protein
VGVFCPVLLLPEGLEQRLSPSELSAVLTHERCHAVWRDNLGAALHMLVEVIFWFHPLVWWLGARLLAERERACDEQVLAEGHAPIEYAEGILKVCEHFLQSRVPYAAGVGGASLQHRIEDIMSNRLIERLGGLKRALIIIVAGGVVAAPIAAGLLTAPPTALAQTPAGVPAAPLTPEFRDVDITVLAMAVGRATGKNFIIDPRVRGKATMVSNAPMTPAALYEAFVGMLTEFRLRAEPTEDPNVIKITPDTTARP